MTFFKKNLDMLHARVDDEEEGTFADRQQPVWKDHQR